MCKLHLNSVMLGDFYYLVYSKLHYVAYSKFTPKLLCILKICCELSFVYIPELSWVTFVMCVINNYLNYMV